MSNTSPQADLIAQLAILKAENERLKAATATADKFSMKVSDKGGVSVYGLGRFPVTLYSEQWTRLLAHAEDMKAFLVANDARLKHKGEDVSITDARAQAAAAKAAAKATEAPRVIGTIVRKA